MKKEPPPRRPPGRSGIGDRPASRTPPAERAPGAAVVSFVTQPPAAARVARWAEALLGRASAPSASVSILLCGDARMRTLNRTFRKIDRPTDVLSFPSGEWGPSRFLGDLAIDVPYAARQARRRGHRVEREVQILLAHGLLHLLGHDHETDDGTMFSLQGTLVRKTFGPGPDGVPEGEGRPGRRG